MLRRIGDALLLLGLVFGVGAIVGYQLDIIPDLPPAVLKLVLYKLTFVGGLGLLVAGAFFRRAAKREGERDELSIGGTNYRPGTLQAPSPRNDFELNVRKQAQQETLSPKKPRSTDGL